MQNTTFNILKTVAKTCEKSLLVEHDFNNTNLVTKVKIPHSQLKSHITKQLLTSMSVAMRIYKPLSDIHYILMSTSLKSSRLQVYLYINANSAVKCIIKQDSFFLLSYVIGINKISKS